MSNIKNTVVEDNEVDVTKKDHKKKKRITLMILLSLAVLIILAVVIYLFINNKETIKLNKDATQFEESTEIVENQITIDCSKNILYDNENNIGIFFYKNHGDSNQIVNLTLQMNEKDLEKTPLVQASEDNIITICESGGILPGYSIDKLRFNRSIPSGIFQARLIINTYNVDTLEKTSFSSSVDVNVLSLD